MITDKEYPATHSMSTAWYAADEDGNVAIINYNENGPVPYGLSENCIANLVWGDDEDSNSKELQISLTDDQIDEMFENPHSLEEEKYWSDTIIQIDMAKEEDFLELTKMHGLKIMLCLSKERGLYMVDVYDCINMDDSVKIYENSALQRMIDNKIIHKVYNVKEMYMNEVWTDDKMTIEKDFDTLPYYIYYQPYCTDFLQERVNVPKNPVKLNQFPESLRRRVPVLPIKFSEKEKIQIAEWVLCNCNSFETAEVDGLEYVLLKLTDGTEAYVLTDENAMDFIQFCSEREKYHCEECKRLECCYTCSTYQRCANPTVMQVINPLNEIDYSECYRRDEISLHSIWQPFMLKIPFKKYAKTNYWVSLEDVRKKFTENQLAEYYKKCYRYLEDRIDFFKPRVLILDEISEEVMSKKYDISNGKVTICGVEYPVFRRSEIETRKAEIEALALLPYRGRKIPHIISKEEMKNLKGE